MIKAIKYFNESSRPPELLVIIRGGGSRDDLVAFDDEALVRSIAGCRVTVLVGVGHEIDETLSDLVADVRASTPSNAAEILVPDKREISAGIESELKHSLVKLAGRLQSQLDYVGENLRHIGRQTENLLELAENQYINLFRTLNQINPQAVLERGYAIIRTESGQILKKAPKIDDKLLVEMAKTKFQVKVIDFSDKVC
jgi:exodeoxyribonuclease VII large subunit